MTGSDTLQSLTTASLWAPQFIARQQPFVVDFIVPFADNRDLEDRAFAASAENGKQSFEKQGPFF